MHLGLVHKKLGFYFSFPDLKIGGEREEKGRRDWGRNIVGREGLYKEVGKVEEEEKEHTSS